MKQINNNEQEYIAGITDVLFKLIAGNEHISVEEAKKRFKDSKVYEYLCIHLYLFMKRVQKTFMKCT